MDKAELFGKNLLQCKIDYKSGGNLYGLFLAHKIKYCLAKDIYGIIREHKTFEGFTNVPDNLDKKQDYKIFHGDILFVTFPLSWEKNVSMGVVIQQKLRNCNKCIKDVLCEGCDKLGNQNKESSASLKELKRQHTIDFGDILPWHKTIWMWQNFNSITQS